MSKIMRYDLVEKSSGMACWKEMERSPTDGDWVRYEDIQHLLKDEQSAPRLLGLEALERHIAEATAPRCSSCKEPVIEPDPDYCPHCAVAFGGRFHLNRRAE